MAGGPDAPAAALPTEVAGDIANIQGRTDLAVHRYRRHAALRYRRDQPVRAVVAELSVALALVNGPRAAEASAVLADAVPRALRTANPTAMTWAHYLSGEATASDDPGRAADHYQAAVEHGLPADSRMFVSMARTSAAALAARTGAVHDALVRFPVVLDEWVGLGNLSAVWFVLPHVVALLVDAGEHADAAVLAGAVEARRDSIPNFAGNLDRIAAAASTIQDRLGGPAAQAALAHGATLSDAAVLARAHAALDAAAAGQAERAELQPAKAVGPAPDTVIAASSADRTNDSRI